MYNLFPQEKLSSSIKGSHHRTNFPNLNLFFSVKFFKSIWIDLIGLSRKFFLVYRECPKWKPHNFKLVRKWAIFAKLNFVFFLDFCQMLSTAYRGQTHIGRGTRRIFCNSTQLRPRAKWIMWLTRNWYKASCLKCNFVNPSSSI